jgi:HSP20 family protein
MKWDPFREIAAPLFGMEPQMKARFFPAFEVKETKEAYAFRAGLPGIEEKDIEITLTANRLTVSGKREEEKEQKGDVFYINERTYGTFTRSFTLPEGIDGEHVTAEVTGGVLNIVVPRKPESQPRKVALKGVVEKVKGAIEKGAKA